LVVERGVESVRVVEGLDVVEDREPGFVAGVEVEVVEPLGLEGVEEALSDGVVDTASRLLMLQCI
jgi:hypothetical protein